MRLKVKGLAGGEIFKKKATRRPPVSVPIFRLLLSSSPTEGRSGDSVYPADPSVEDAAADTGVDLAEFIGRGDNRGQPGVIAVIEKLIELFPHPGCH
jgi:hypothetical protein